MTLFAPFTKCGEKGYICAARGLPGFLPEVDHKLYEVHLTAVKFGENPHVLALAISTGGRGI